MMAGRCPELSRVHAAMHSKKALAGDKDFYKDMAVYYARSILFGATMGTTFCVSSCIMVRLVGGFAFWTALLVPGSISGLSIAVEHIYRRRIVMNTFYNMTLDYLYLRAQVAGLVRRTAAAETAAFMALNGLLLYLLHKAGSKKRSTPVFWFFIPDGERSDQSNEPKRICPVPHKGTCWESAVQATAKYSAVAAALQALRVVMNRGGQIAKSPNVFFSHFLSRKTAAGIASLGGYVLLYKVVRCVLGVRQGADMCHHSAVAGLIAGSAYWLQPNTTILSSALIAIIRLLLDYLPRRAEILVKWPMPELLFALCNGILIHARCMDMAHCPKFIVHMLDTATRNRSQIIYDAYMQQVNRIQFHKQNHT
ncbi:uncharacterized protein LOC117650264 isoform X2 [Thrips palmi]|uniref:Uncharacterized protein LOC117650264 isoform X2 n=1 Tax=Thrips palmi TaxID=161013 RepID=A0A6P8ZWD3_THRPL|nr:uncharacterized protein LOC117650264 isoform X2 [Thrips palmi]